MQPPAAVRVDEVAFNDQVLQDVLWLLLAAQHQPPKAVIDGQSLRDKATSRNGQEGPSCF